jgi:hypothetical protein
MSVAPQQTFLLQRSMGPQGPAAASQVCGGSTKKFFYFLKTVVNSHGSHLQNGAVLAYSVGIDLEISSRIMQLTFK